MASSPSPRFLALKKILTIFFLLMIPSGVQSLIKAVSRESVFLLAERDIILPGVIVGTWTEPHRPSPCRHHPSNISSTLTIFAGDAAALEAVLVSQEAKNVQNQPEFLAASDHLRTAKEEEEKIRAKQEAQASR